MSRLLAVGSEEERSREAHPLVPPSADHERRQDAARPPLRPLGAACGGDRRSGGFGRPAAQPGAAACRERPPPSAAARASAQRQAPGRDAGGSRPPGAARRSRPCLVSGTPPHPAGDAAALAPRRVPRALAAEVAPGVGPPATPGGNHWPDPAAGDRQSSLGGRADPGRTGQTGRRCGQARYPGLPPQHPCPTATRADAGDVPAQSRPEHPGRRLPPGHRPGLPPALRLRRRRARHAPRAPRRCHAPPHRRPGRPAAARGDAVRPAPPVPHPRQRPQV